MKILKSYHKNKKTDSAQTSYVKSIDNVFGYIAAGAKWGINAFKATKFVAKVTDVCSNIGKLVKETVKF